MTVPARRPVYDALDRHRSEADYIDRTIATVRNHREADNCWPQWANIFADEIEDLRADVQRLTEGLRDAAVVIEKMANGASREEVEPEFSRFHALCCDEHTEFAWLVERGQSEGHDRPIWAEPELSDGRFGWTFDANLARRFPTKEAAEDYIASRDNLTARAVEHGFVARALLAGEPDGGGA